MATRQRVPRRIRRDRRAAAFHSDRMHRATTPVEQYRAAADALVSALRHHGTRREVRDLRDEVVAHARNGIDRVWITGRRRESQLTRLAEAGRDARGLGEVLAVLQGVIRAFPDTERDRMFVHYSEHFSAEARRFESRGGGL